MIQEGVDAPAVALPAYVDGERREVDLGEYIGEGIVVLVFYPADFNPACTMQTADLGDLDLFTMQKDVSVFAVSPDSTYSHEAFAERYSLNVPLLSDRDGEAARAYDVTLATDDGESLCQRAVFVVDHRGVVQYAWATDDLEERPDIDPVKQAVGDIGGDDTALERYRVGFGDYTEGREAFTSAMAAYEDHEWMDAHNDFADAEAAFASAADHLDTAVRFAETAAFETVVDRVEEKADTLRHAAEWLAESADAYASGSGKSGQQYRQDADPLLEAAKDLPEPAPPDQFDRTGDGIELDDAIVVEPDDGDEGYAWRAGDTSEAAELGIDDAELDAAVDVAVDESDEERVDHGDSEGDTIEGDLEMDVESVETTDDEGGDESDGDSPIEGDTVEGDLEMDMDALDADEGRDDESGGEGGGSDPGTRDGATSDGGDERSDSPSDVAAGPDDTAPDGARDSEASAISEDGPEGTHEASGAIEESGDAEDGSTESEETVELDLADPTEGEDDEDDDERTGWDIPGQ